MDKDEIAASDRLLARHPVAQVWMRQVGSRYARRLVYLVMADSSGTIDRLNGLEHRFPPSVFNHSSRMP